MVLSPFEPNIEYLNQILYLSTAITAGNESTIRVLATTISSVGRLDTGRAVSSTLATTAPIEDPVVRVLLQLTTGWGSAGIRTACAVGSAFNRVVLVVGLEDSECLGLGSASVVGALGRLDGFRDLCGYFMTVSTRALHLCSLSSRTTAVQATRFVTLGVRRSWSEGSCDNSWCSKQGDKVGEMHFER